MHQKRWFETEKKRKKRESQNRYYRAWYAKNKGHVARQKEERKREITEQRHHRDLLTETIAEGVKTLVERQKEEDLYRL